jgi:hypothetical protein
MAKAWDWEGNGFRSREEPRNSMEHLQRICVSKPKSQPEDLERHLVHWDNHGSSVLDPRVSLEDIDEEYTNMTGRQLRWRAAGPAAGEFTCL